MATWIRIFSTNDAVPAADGVIRHLEKAGFDVTSEIIGDLSDWEQILLATPEMASQVMLERIAPDDPEVNDEVEPLLEWIDSVEDVLDVAEIERVLRTTRQLYILGMPGGMHSQAAIEKLALGLSQFLAQQTKGIYQIDQEGFYDAEGNLLLEEKR